MPLLKRITLASLLIIFSWLRVFGQDSKANPDIVGRLDGCNVKWDIPGPGSAQSMPLGNGDIGLNVWCETNGDLAFYIGKGDTWAEDVFGDQGLMKPGGVRMSLTPNPFSEGAPFSQVLKLHEGEIEVREGYATNEASFRIWVDANHPVIRVEVASASQPVSLNVSLMDWRFGGGHPDQVVAAQTNRIVWYHRNGAQANAHVANLTFGAMITGAGLANASPTNLVSTTPAHSQLVSIYPLTATTSSAEEWVSQLAAHAGQLEPLDMEETRQAHRVWWDEFWHRSWVYVTGDTDATNVTEGYVLQRFITACAGRGAFPIKFNGSIFVVDNPAKNYTPDHRDWGGQYWFQNTRAMYWPRLAAGDFDLMLPLFNMYLGQLPGNTEQVSEYYHHPGAYFAETAPYWGGLKYWGPEVPESWTGHYFVPILELSMMMLDYYEFTGDTNFLQKTLLPIATAGLDFYDHHFSRDEQGKLLLDPVNSIETYWKVRDPAPDIAGLHAVLSRLLALPEGSVDAARRAQWQTLWNALPDLPVGIRNGKRSLLPYAGEQTAKVRNGENPELYAIYPFRLYGLEKPGLPLALNTFNTRKMRQKGCWVQDPIQAAMLGLPDVAREYLVFNLTRREPGLKFPAFWAKANDYPPDEDNGGNAEHALQQMLMQTDGKKIFLLPAWPAGWNAEFKLNAPFRTTVQGRIQDGRLADLVVNPPERRADVIDLSSRTNAPSLAEGPSLRVACVGDSIVYGAGVENRERNNWPAVLGRWLGDGWDVRNFGVNGTTMLKQGDSPYWNQKAFAEAVQFKPDILVISLGANDSKHPTAEVRDAAQNWEHKADFVNNYEEMISAFKAANPSVEVYTCVPLPAYPGHWGIDDTTIREEVAPLVRQVARETGATVIDLYTAMSGKSELFPDTVHPNAAGARLVAAAVYHSLTGKQPPEATFPLAVKSEASGSETLKSILSPHDPIEPLKQTFKGGPNVLAVSGDFGGSGDDELVSAAIDGNIHTKYFNKGHDANGSAPGINSGFVVAPASGDAVVNGIQFATGNDMPERDPLRITIEGSNDPNAAQEQGGGFVPMYEGPAGLQDDPGRNAWGRVVSFKNSAAYRSYRVLVTETRDSADATQYGEVKLGAVLPAGK